MRRLVGFPVFLLLATALSRAEWTHSDVPDAGNFYSFAVSGKSLFAGTVGGLFRSDDNGNTWTHIGNLGSGSTVYSVLTSGSGLYAVPIASAIQRSRDLGDSWTEANAGLPLAVFPILAAGDGYLYDATESSGAFRSRDSGESWTSANNGLTYAWVTSFAVSGSTLFAGTLDDPGGSSGSLFRSTNHGDSWTEVHKTLMLLDRQTLAISGSTVFAASRSDNPGVFRSRDNGDSWEPANNGLKLRDIYSLLASGAFLFAAGPDGVFCSRNAGDDWTRIDEGSMNGNLYAMAVFNSTLFVGANGAVWKRPLSEITTAVQFSGPKAYSGITPGSLYRPGDRISFFLRHGTEVRLGLSDILGRESILMQGVMAQGGHSAALPGDFPKGPYLLRLSADGETRSQRIVIY
jgi:photosystem II stability/assembly factor-like uncharacterized protein